MAAFKNYYEILGVELFADTDSVKSAFRKLARQHHPDLNANNRQAEEKFKEINEAYEILSDPAKRAMHDATLQSLNGRNQDKTTKSTSKKQEPEKPKEQQSPPKTTTAQEQTKKEEAQPTKNNKPINDLFESFLK